MSERPSCFFVLPENSALPSGGNIYNRHFLAALAKQQVPLKVLDWEGFLHAEAPGNYFVDTLFMQKLSPFKQALPKQRNFLLVHHLESLFPPPERSSDALFLEEEKPILDQFSGFLATSNFSKDYLMLRGYHSEQIFVIPPALSFEPQKEKRNLDTLRVLIVANLVERKGILELLDAFMSLASLPDNFQIRILGSDQIEPHYASHCKQKLAQSPDLAQRISFAGEIPPNQMVEQYTWANLLISAAKMETFGMAIQEALASGLPVLCMEGGYSGQHIRSAENGFSYAAIPDLVDGFVSLCGNRDLHQKLCTRLAKQRPESYTWDQAADLFIQALFKFHG